MDVKWIGKGNRRDCCVYYEAVQSGPHTYSPGSTVLLDRDDGDPVVGIVLEVFNRIEAEPINEDDSSDDDDDDDDEKRKKGAKCLINWTWKYDDLHIPGQKFLDPNTTIYLCLDTDEMEIAALQSPVTVYTLEDFQAKEAKEPMINPKAGARRSSRKGPVLNYACDGAAVDHGTSFVPLKLSEYLGTGSIDLSFREVLNKALQGIKAKRRTNRNDVMRTPSKSKRPTISKAVTTPKKRPSGREKDYAYDESNDVQNAKDLDVTYQTPTKKKNRGQSATPRSIKSKKTPTSTPTRKHIIKNPLEITPLPLRVISNTASQLSGRSSPHSIARSRLHVSAVPAVLKRREAECEEIKSQLEAAIEDGGGLCLYICGTPGTGKTASVHQVIRSLRAQVEEDVLADFLFVEINGMRVSEPAQAYCMLYQTISDGKRVSPAVALQQLDLTFGARAPKGMPV